MPRTPAAVRYLTLHRLAFCVTALTVLVAAAATAATAAFASASATVANRQALAANPASPILVTAQTPRFAAASALVTRVITGAAAGLPMGFLTARQSNPLDLPAGRGGPRAQTLLLSAQDARRHVRVVAGAWPSGRASGAAGGAVAACLPVTAARLLGLAPGDELTVRDSLSRVPALIRIGCLFAAVKPASPYWRLDPLGAGAVSRAGGFTIYGPLVTAEPAAAWPVPATSARWLAVPDFAAMTAGNLASLGTSLGTAVTVLSDSRLGLTVTTSLPGLLSEQAVALRVARSQLLIGELILLVVAGSALAVAVHLLASQRSGEPGLLMARGATRRQLAAQGGTDAVLLALPTAILGPLIGTWMVPVVARLGGLGSTTITLPSGPPLSAWLAGIAVAAGCAVIIALPWLRRPLSPVRRRAALARPRTLAATLASGADLALVLLAGGAAWQLARSSGPASGGLSGAVGVDPVLVAAPVLALTAGTLITLRLLPPLIRLTERMAARGRGVTGPVAAWMISRRTLRQVGPALLAVLGVAVWVIALGEVRSWQQSVHDQAEFAVGADASVSLPPAAPLRVGQVGEITAASGVAGATPVIDVPFVLPDNSQATLLALDPARARWLTPIRSDLVVKPAGHPFRPIAGSGTGPGEVVPGRPRQLQVTAILSGAALTGASLTVQVSDAAGVSYQLPAGQLPADGRSHRFDVTIGSRADYPLTLTGFALSYQLPRLDPARTAALSIGSVRPVGAGGAAGPPLPAPWPSGPATPQVSVSVPQLTPASGDSPSGAPREIRLSPHALLFATGAGLDLATFGATGATISVTPHAPAVLPAIATGAFLASSGQHLGDVIEVSALSEPVRVRLAGEVAAFPTITSPAGGVVVNQAALQAYLEAHGAAPQPVTQWWTGGGPAVFGHLPAGSTVTTTAAVLRSLSGQSLAVAPLRSMLAVAVVALVLAGLGFVVSVGAERDRGRDLAVLDALGATPGQLAGVLCLEQGILSVPAAGAGLALGLLLSRLVIPAVTLTAQAARPVPPVLVRIPVLPVLAIAVVVAALPVAVVAVSVLRGTRAAARLRAEEDA